VDGRALVGLFVPGDSPLHRTRPGLKLLVLTVFLLVLGLWRSLPVVAAGAALVGIAAAVARLPARTVLAQARPLLWVAVAIGIVQVWSVGLEQAVVVVGSLVVAVCAAGLVTLTTRTDDLVSALVTVLKPMRRFGVDPDRVAFTLALTVRAVPVLVRIVDDVREARRARGAERSPRALAVPVVMRTVRYADQLGEALAARGLNDDDV
jgi:biotin transport system permease protein